MDICRSRTSKAVVLRFHQTQNLPILGADVWLCILRLKDNALHPHPNLLQIKQFNIPSPVCASEKRIRLFPTIHQFGILFPFRKFTFAKKQLRNETPSKDQESFMMDPFFI